MSAGAAPQYAFSMYGDEAWLMEKGTGRRAIFDRRGNKLRGDFDYPAVEIRFMIWSMPKSPSIPAHILRQQFEAQD